MWYFVGVQGLHGLPQPTGSQRGLARRVWQNGRAALCWVGGAQFVQ